jgi:hypothetical protein
MALWSIGETTKLHWRMVPPNERRVALALFSFWHFESNALPQVTFTDWAEHLDTSGKSRQLKVPSHRTFGAPLPLAFTMP